MGGCAMIPELSIIIPAWNEEERISDTLQVLQQIGCSGLSIGKHEIIVVDDGSTDDTYTQAWPWADALVKHPQRRGKGSALASGIRVAKGETLMFLDADLRESAAHAAELLGPIYRSEADMVIGRLPRPANPAGFGVVKGLARRGIYKLSGYATTAPLSGQRAVRSEVLQRIRRLSKGYGIEVGLTIDTVRLGYRIKEVDVPFLHRETGGDWHGLLHRGKQLFSVGTTLIGKWRERDS